MNKSITREDSILFTLLLLFLSFLMLDTITNNTIMSDPDNSKLITRRQKTTYSPSL